MSKETQQTIEDRLLDWSRDTLMYAIGAAWKGMLTVEQVEDEVNIAYVDMMCRVRGNRGNRGNDVPLGGADWMAIVEATLHDANEIFETTRSEQAERFGRRFK